LDAVDFEQAVEGNCPLVKVALRRRKIKGLDLFSSIQR
jgi:hypothetical protein